MSDVIETKLESLGEVKNAVENYDHTDESVAVTSFNEIEVESDGRLTICLKCGLHVSGTHANVSYCFSEHMCDSTAMQDQHLKAICVIANAMYTNTMRFGSVPKNTTSTPNSSINQPLPSDEVSKLNVSAIVSTLSKPNQPFNFTDIRRALKDLLE